MDGDKDLSKKSGGHSYTLRPRKKRCLILIGDSDRLTALPKDMQSKILESLPTADAAKLAFTSRTWNASWRSIPKLIFKPDEFPGNYDTFVRFIHHGLGRHDDSDIPVLELWFWPYMGSRNIIYIGWIRTAIKHNVRKLVLFGKMHRTKEILKCVFLSTSIVKLELAIENYLLTWSGSLPKLRKLKLKFVDFGQASSPQLSSFCPALEKLSIMFCDMTSFEAFQVYSPKLTDFVICYCPGMGDCSFSFQTPSLSKFIWISEGRRIESVPTQLFALVISDQEYSLQNETNTNLTSEVIKLTRELFKGQFPVFNWRLVQNLSMVPNLPRHLKVDAFYNVKSLTIGLRLDMATIRTVVHLISRCVSATSVILEVEGSSNETVNFPDFELNLRDYSFRSLSSLNCVSFRNFEGGSLDLMLVRWMLANVRRSMEMDITMNDLMHDNRDHVMEAISGFETAHFRKFIYYY